VSLGLVEQLEWDSLFFGLPIGRVRDNVAADEIESAVREAHERKLRCIYLLASADDNMLIGSAQEQGFIVRDIRVELERPVAGHPMAMEGIRPGRVGDMSRLAEIARERFRDTRFFTDDGFPPDRSEELYVEWLRRGLTDEPDRQTLVTKDATGFIVCHLDPRTKVGKIELIGVAAGSSGHGLGSALIAGAGTIFDDALLCTATVVTQGNNITAQRLYQRHGYRVSKTQLWLHRWL
jgi:dTDP-4-amino-4,6-dideoxy-D-galactose acyltransferase